MRGSTLVLLGLAAWLLTPSLTTVQANESTPADLEFFEKKIRPVLVEHCCECHSAEAGETEGGLLLDTQAAILKGGEAGRPSWLANLRRAC